MYTCVNGMAVGSMQSVVITTRVAGMWAPRSGLNTVFASAVGCLRWCCILVCTGATFFDSHTGAVANGKRWPHQQSLCKCGQLSLLVGRRYALHTSRTRQ